MVLSCLVKLVCFRGLGKNELQLCFQLREINTFISGSFSAKRSEVQNQTVIIMLKPTTENVFRSVQMKKKLEVSAQSTLSISENPSHRHSQGWVPMVYPNPVTSPSLSELIGPVRDTQPKMNQSNLLFPEPGIKILRCWPDSAELLSQIMMRSGVSGRSREGQSAEREKQDEADMETKAEARQHVRDGETDLVLTVLQFLV